MNRLIIINLLTMVAVSMILAGCNRWGILSESNNYTPLKLGEISTVTLLCTSVDNIDKKPTCNDVFEQYIGFSSVEKKCYKNDESSIIVTYSMTPTPTVTNSYLLTMCGIATNGATNFLDISRKYSKSTIITPSSTAESRITLSPGQQQKLTLTLPFTKTSQIGSKFIILESQQYLSFVGNENSCTINANQSSCSVTVQANSNITTTVNQTLQVVTSEFPTESVFIKIAPSGPKYIFVSQSITAGNFGGFASADNLCNTDGARTTYPTQLGNGTFKALLNGNNATVIGTEYKNLAGESIATATTTNLVAEDTGLTNPIGKTPSGTQDGQYAWTGLARTGVSAIQNCNNWTDNTNVLTGTAGYVSVTSGSWAVASAGATTCDSANVHLYCVQQ